MRKPYPPTFHAIGYQLADLKKVQYNPLCTHQMQAILIQQTSASYDARFH